MKHFKFRVWDHNENKFSDRNYMINRNGNICAYNGHSVTEIDSSNLETVFSTGLFDMKGKESYVGDIIKYHHDGGYQLIERTQDDCDSKYHWFSGFRIRYDDFEIIGNKFENHELLENL